MDFKDHFDYQLASNPIQACHTVVSFVSLGEVLTIAFVTEESQGLTVAGTVNPR
jgi:hypothetical protein